MNSLIFYPYAHMKGLPRFFTNVSDIISSDCGVILSLSLTGGELRLYSSPHYKGTEFIIRVNRPYLEHIHVVDISAYLLTGARSFKYHQIFSYTS